jgi:hypothetical protein
MGYQLVVCPISDLDRTALCLACPTGECSDKGWGKHAACLLGMPVLGHHVLWVQLGLPKHTFVMERCLSEMWRTCRSAASDTIEYGML